MSDGLVTFALKLITWFLQLPMLLIHALGLEMLLSTVQNPLSKADNVTNRFFGPFRTNLSPLEEKSNISSVKETTQNTEPIHQKIINATDIIEIVHAHGYKCHEHVVQTQDGYLLSIHRILSKRITPSTTEIKQMGKPVVYMHHGLLTNSELFVLGDSTSRCLPFVLVELGYDVWLGNNRGNKYSRKHINLSPSSYKFWDYSLDEFAMFDIPNTIDYILKATSQADLSYIGFSQGSAQCLAALSLNPSLNSRINIFIGLSPAMIPKSLNHPLASFFVHSASRSLFRLFGRRAILPSVVFWQKLMGPSLYEMTVDKSLYLLFGWEGRQQRSRQKAVGYPHMFSPSSVKSVVHWFQIIKNARFQMYDEGGGAGSNLAYLSGTSKIHRIAPFPTQTITTPMMLVYGTSDTLVDIDKVLENISCKVDVVPIDKYEHMDTLWADSVENEVFSKVVRKLEEYNFNDNYSDSPDSPLTLEVKHLNIAKKVHDEDLLVFS